ncbi:unnamed protein product [Arctogadus glacialis]
MSEGRLFHHAAAEASSANHGSLLLCAPPAPLEWITGRVTRALQSPPGEELILPGGGWTSGRGRLVSCGPHC